jgi:predicted nucleic acid-binding protein
MIVLDANIIIRAALGVRVKKLLEDYFLRGIRFFAPDQAFADAEKYLPSLLEKRGSSPAALAQSMAYLRKIVAVIGPDDYAPFELDARQRLRSRDEDDWPVLASALALGCGIWTEDADFFGTGVAVWTTSRIEIFLKQQAETITPQDE